LSYMAPEQAASNETDQRSDLFSVGIILWESLTGRRLFKGDSNGATLNKLLNDPITSPSELWSELEPYDEVVTKALSRDPEQRFQTADEFAEALDAVAGRTGLAKTRDVAEVVRELDADKLQDERQRVRDAIDLLGRAEIAASKVPMPRDSTGRVSLANVERVGTGSYVHGPRSGAQARGTQAPSAPESHLLKWLVMLLAVAVFGYAGFLAWHLSHPQRTQAPSEVLPRPAEADAPAPAPAGSRGSEDRPPHEANQAAPEPEKPSATPERKTSASTSRTRRRQARQRSPRQTASPSEPRGGRAAPPVEAPKPDPVDIDIANPYRN